MTKQRAKVEQIDTGPRRELEQLEAVLTEREAPIRGLQERHDKFSAQVAAIQPILDYWGPRDEQLRALLKGLQDMEATIRGDTGPPFGIDIHQIRRAADDLSIQIDRLNTVRENLATWRAEMEQLQRQIAALEERG